MKTTTLAGMVKNITYEGFDVVLAKIDTEGNVIYKKLKDSGYVDGNFTF